MGSTREDAGGREALSRTRQGGLQQDGLPGPGLRQRQGRGVRACGAGFTEAAPAKHKVRIKAWSAADAVDNR